MGATPQLLELEDVESGRIRRVEWTDPGLDTSPKQTRDREDLIHTVLRGRTYRSPDGEPVLTSYVNEQM